MDEELEHPEITRLKWRGVMEDCLRRRIDPSTDRRIDDAEEWEPVRSTWQARLDEDDKENTPRMIMDHYEGSMTVQELRTEVRTMLPVDEFVAWERRWSDWL